MHRLFWLLSILLAGCSSPSEERNTIEIKTDAAEIFVNGKKVPIEKLKADLKERKENILSKGYKEGDLIITVLMDSSTKAGVAAQIVLILRELNVRNIKYVNLSEELSLLPSATVKV